MQRRTASGSLSFFAHDSVSLDAWPMSATVRQNSRTASTWASYSPDGPMRSHRRANVAGLASLSARRLKSVSAR